jgi:hypothetical protein
MIEQLVFKIPSAFAQCIADGSCQRYGAIIKDQAGTIVGHIQETGMMGQIVSAAPSILTAANPLNTFATMASVGLTALSNVQLQHMQVMLESLKSLSFVSIGVSTLGLGVSVAGFYLMNTKLNGIGTKVDQLTNTVKIGFLKQEQARIRQHISAVRGLLNDADAAHTCITASNEYRRIANLFDQEYAFFFGEIEHFLKQEKFELAEIEQLIQLMAVCHNARIRCLLLADEYELAKAKSQQNTEDYGQLFDDIDIIGLTHKLLGEGPHKSFIKAFNETMQGNNQTVGTKDFIANMREIKAVAASKVYLIDSLIKTETPGKVFFDRLKEQQEPIVVISH